MLCATLPAGVALRLDANTAWSAADAERFLAACLALPIDGIEEPLRSPDLATLHRLQAMVPFPLAIDESTQLVTCEFWQAPPVRRLVIKPARHGGLLASVELGLRAQAAGLECIVTASLESACGCPCLRPPGRRHCTGSLPRAGDGRLAGIRYGPGTRHPRRTDDAAADAGTRLYIASGMNRWLVAHD